MLVLSYYKCDKCKKEESGIIQSSNFECTKCKTKQILCDSCKQKGCINIGCNGRLLDSWDRNHHTKY